MSSAAKGFTLIEILVVVSIIALLSTIVLTSMTSKKNRAKDVSFQATVKSIQKSAGICCTGGTATLLDALGGNICTMGSEDTYPSSINIGSVTITRNCASVDGYLLRITPGTSNAGTIDYADCDRDDCVFVDN